MYKVIYICYTFYRTIQVYRTIQLYSARIMEKKYTDVIQCDKGFVMALTDTLNVVSGKWKLAIVCTLLTGKKRFSEIERTITHITPRMVSKELKELEINGVVKRKVFAGETPVLVEYELTDSGKALSDVIIKMVEWGLQHRVENLAEI